MQRSPYIEDDDFENISARFLLEHNPNGVIPVSIESIVEFSLIMDIVPVAGLMNSAGINAFITRDKKEIRVDKGLYEHDGTRYRFSLAHELAHMLLGHDKLLDEFVSVDNWIQYFRDLPGDVYASVEHQANRLAGCILVPIEGFKEKFDEYIKRFEGENATALAKQDAAERLLARDYDVSVLTIHYRLKYLGLLNYPGL